MSRVSACRVCLSSELNMYAIADTPLQAVYEKLTGSELQSADARPACVCYICLHQLRKCDSFIRRAVKADALLTEMITKNFEMTTESINAIDRKSSNLIWTLEVTKQDLVNVTMAYEVTFDPLDVKLEHEVGGVDEIQVHVKCEAVDSSEIAKFSCDDSNTVKHERSTENEAKGESTKSTENEKSEQKISTNRRDLRKRTSGKPFKCEHCRLSFTRRQNFVTHLTNHAGVKYFKCEYCSYACLSASTLRAHKRRRHPNKKKQKVEKIEKPHICEYCSFAFKQKSTLVVHIRRHTGEKPYKCEICSFTCSTQAGIIQHRISHTGDKRHKCDICEARFMSKSELRVHTRIHTGEKPYKCEYCSYSCAAACNLKRHTRTHTGEKPYKCPHCTSAFISTGELNSHIRTHTGEKPYKCEHCNYCCTKKCHLKKHFMRIHPDKTYISVRAKSRKRIQYENYQELQPGKMTDTSKDAQNLH